VVAVDEAALLAELSVDVREPLVRARDASIRAEAGDKEASRVRDIETANAVSAAGIPAATMPLPLASDYTSAQRAVLALSAMYGLAVLRHACPQYPVTRRRWVGLDPAGVLETHVVDGDPLWRALQRDGSPKAQAERLDSLPLDVALAALTELAGTGRGYGVAVPPHLQLISRLGPATRDWAIAAAERSPAEPFFTLTHLKKYIFLGLARASVPIEERWEELFPNLEPTSFDEHVEATRALEEARRPIVLAKHLASMQHGPELVAAFPSKAMVEALLGTVEPRSRRWTYLVERLREVGDDVARRAVDEIVLATPEPIALYVSRTVKPKSVADLDAIAQEQLRIAGRGYDGHDLPAEERLARNGEETSFAKFVELRTVVDAARVPLYDLWIYMFDSGSIFAAGTTREIGAISQGGVVLREPNVALRLGLQAMTVKSPPKKTSAKKTRAKKT
jgi:hypothetical protein